jgi:hypothetical protein
MDYLRNGDWMYRRKNSEEEKRLLGLSFGRDREDEKMNTKETQVT